jgi:hypothetical protein
MIGMVCEWFHYLLAMLTLVFAIASVIAGIFTAYFGSGKSRAVGAILIIIGLIAGVFFLWCAYLLQFLGAPPIGFVGCVTTGVAAVVGAIIGALIALGIFLLAIMKA